MNKEFVDAFYQLDTNIKKDKLSRELLVIGEYLRHIEKRLGIENEVDIYNYNPATDKEMDDDEYLTSLYQDIFNVERELITIERLLRDNKTEKERMMEE
mgnify:CR=1 FL=1